MSLFARTDKSFLGQWWWTVDRGMLAAFLTLAVFGIALVATASPPVAERIGLDYYHFLKRHVIILLPALVLLVGLSFLNHRQIRRLATLAFVGSVAAMIVVLATGMEIKGAQRWVHVFGFSLQPSEFVKPSFAILAAWLMAMQKEKRNFPGNGITAGLYFLTITLLLLQPDLGMTVIVTAIWAAQIFLAGFPFRLLAVLVALGVVGITAAYFTFDHVQSRIDRWRDTGPDRDCPVDTGPSPAVSCGRWCGRTGKGRSHHDQPRQLRRIEKSCAIHSQRVLRRRSWKGCERWLS